MEGPGDFEEKWREGDEDKDGKCNNGSITG
jgi:hypothetical protein